MDITHLLNDHGPVKPSPVDHQVQELLPLSDLVTFTPDAGAGSPLQPQTFETSSPSDARSYLTELSGSLSRHSTLTSCEGSGSMPPDDEDLGEIASLDGADDAQRRAFSCSSCPKKFARRSDLARHGKLSRSECFFSVTSFRADASIERIHTGVRPHFCPHPGCNKKFIQRSALTVHERVHTGEKPHTCEKCSKVCLLCSYMYG